MEKLYLLDAYALIYRAYYALIRSPRVNSKGQNTSAIYGFVNTLEEIRRKAGATHMGVAFDPAGPTFRHEAFEAYKAQRESTPEDIKLSIPIIKDIIRAYNIPILEVPGFEADDVIGTLATKAAAEGLDTYMVTPDKDYGQLVGPHVWQYKLTPMGLQVMDSKKICAKYGIETPTQVIDLLGLMGDTSDNIPGCPGVGEKTAIALIKQFGSIEKMYESTDELRGKLREKIEQNKEQVLFSKFLVTIKRDVPIALDREALAVRPINTAQLREIFEALEFRSFIKRICGDAKDENANSNGEGGRDNGDGGRGNGLSSDKERKTKSKKATQNSPEQLDLFAIFADNSSESSNEAILSEEKTYGTNYKLAVSAEDRAAILAKICAQKKVAFSLSTTTLNPINAEIVSVAMATDVGDAWLVAIDGSDAGAAEVMRELATVFADEEIEKVAHDVKFAINVLLGYGIRMRGPVFDTMLAHYLIQPELNHSLYYLSEIYLHHQSTPLLEPYFGSKWGEERNMRLVPDEVRMKFECERADIALRLVPHLKDALAKLNAEPLFRNIEVPLAGVLARMERSGVTIAPATLRETSRLFSQRMAEYEAIVYEQAGHRFNLSSPKQVGEVLFGEMHLIEKPKKTKSGQYVTSESVLEELRGKAPIVDSILQYRGMKKLLSTYVDALPNLVNVRTGRIHSSFNQAVTATGRLSSSNPNLQNIPVRGDDGKEIRKAFVPEAGQRFFSADYSQIELRIMAHLSGDTHMIEAFRNGYDIHAATAAKIFHKDITDITSDERRKAKTANFGIIYGITVFGLAQRMGVNRSEAKELIDNYFIQFPRVRSFMDECIEQARRNGYVETMFHRRRYLPDINSQNAVVRGYAERNAINAPIQGSAADIIKVAMVNVQKRFDEAQLKSKLILQVHDELNFTVAPDESDIVQRIVRTEMENACSMQVPLEIDCGWGENWLEAH